MCTLKIIMQTKSSTQIIYIYNIYNPLPTSYFSTESPSTLPTIKEQMTTGAHHVLLGNFNLHHTFWNGPSRPTQHAAADQLLEIVDDINLSLTLPKGIVTWEARNLFSTIDLIFMSEYLSKRLEHCMSRPELNQSSNYIPISTCILLDSKQQVNFKHQTWKLLDLEKLREVKRHAPAPVTTFQTLANIDTYTESIQKFLQNVIEAAVP